MPLFLRSVAESNVGLVRKQNEDSGYAGPRLLIVADGMGGHAAGEVASAITVNRLSELDGPVYDADPDTVAEALTAAVRLANQEIRHRVELMPQHAGMGTTVTAALWTGSHLGLIHLGDSRAYLLRGGVLHRITHDHTYVQMLIDDGRITPAEAETHPARSLLLQALDGRDEPQLDFEWLAGEPDDVILLCSDGLSGPTTEEQLRTILLDHDDLHETATQLIAAALRAGAPDNVTVVLGRLESGVSPFRSDDTVESYIVGAVSEGAAEPTPVPGSGTETPRVDDHAPYAPEPPSPPVPARAAVLTAAEAEEAQRFPGQRRAVRWGRRVAVTALVVVGLGAALGQGQRWVDSQYFVAVDRAAVSTMRGVPALAQYATVVERAKGLPFAALPEVFQTQVSDGIRAESAADARDIVERLRREACQAHAVPAASTTGTPRATASGSASPSASGTVQASPLASSTPKPAATGTPTGSASPSPTPSPSPSTAPTVTYPGLDCTGVFQ